jgi:hypothetical protein
MPHPDRPTSTRARRLAACVLAPLSIAALTMSAVPAAADTLPGTQAQATAQAAPSEVTLPGGEKPVAAPGERVTLALAGLRPGTRVKAAFQDRSAGSGGTSTRAAADGAAQVKVRVASRTAEGRQTLKLTGDDVVARDVFLTVLEGGAPDPEASTEPVLESVDFEKGTVPRSQRTWEYLTSTQVQEEYGLERRQAFTRGSGRVAHIDAETSAADATLTTRSLKLPKDASDLQLRVDSHYLAGQEASTAKIVLDYGSKGTRELTPFDLSASDESHQLRIPLDVPAKAGRVKVGFEFSAPEGGGNWSVDNVQLVRALPELDPDETPSDVVDIISDVQGDTGNQRLEDVVLPGLATFDRPASTLVVNGDQVNGGNPAEYDRYLSALNTGEDRYQHVISTIGNHEYYGSQGSEHYKNLWLQKTGMSKIGGQGGLWGEQVLPGGTPMLWLGSEKYEYSQHTGNGPFVEISDRQYSWLKSRLDHYHKTGTPVLLFSHHVLPNTVSATYGSFYGNDYGDDTERLTELLAKNPSVTMFNSHTHWDVRLNDWAADLRNDPTQAVGPTLFNTGSLTTAYGPSGDWGEKAVSGASPVALRAYVYGDRTRVVAYSFEDGKPQKIKHLDVPHPAAGR